MAKAFRTKQLTPRLGQRRLRSSSSSNNNNNNTTNSSGNMNSCITGSNNHCSNKYCSNSNNCSNNCSNKNNSGSSSYSNLRNRISKYSKPAYRSRLMLLDLGRLMRSYLHKCRHSCCKPITSHRPSKARSGLFIRRQASWVLRPSLRMAVTYTGI